MATYSIVIAYYDEDISWTNTTTVKTHVYNKNSNSPGPNTLPNVGREAHTYVHHIITHYDNLDPVTVFLQGTPFDHMPKGCIQQLVAEAETHPSGLSQNAKVHEVGNNNAYFDFTIKVHAGKPVAPFESGKTFGEWLKTVANYRYTMSPRWYIGACFAATREAIRSVPLDQWLSIYESLSYDINPVTGHYMERSWYMLLDLERSNPRKNIL